MAFWVYGKDATSGRPAEMFSDADTPEAAKDQAREQGITAERVEPDPGAPPAAAPPRPDLDARPPGVNVTAASGPEYEFTAEQNRLIGDLAGKMRFVGLFLILGGALQCLTLFAGLLGGFFSGLVYIFLGVWTRGAAASFRQIVDTQGADVSHLMAALGELQKMYWLQYVLLLLALVVFAVLV